MAGAWATYERLSRQRKRRAARAGKRLDIQGLRMVAVLTVFANHLWEWPRGGFVGVDVFFVISGFLITGNLLRDAEKNGAPSFKTFYWNRVRRIVPAAALILVLTVVAAYMVFLPFRAREVGIDAAWAFVFLSNWWFGYQGTDYFRAAADTVSPVQHYWSLSIEEQFYFVWPALVFLVSVYAARKMWPHERRMQLTGAVMGLIVALSFGWALFETATDAEWAYFSTFSRVWELGIGAFLACAVSVLERIPYAARPALSWGGLAMIAASVVVISDDAGGFPAPWALLPVVGSALVIAAGVGEEPEYQAFLRNPVSGYIGDISYSLYLAHWPVIIILAAVMDYSWYYDVAVIAIALGLAIGSYHLVENTLRRGDWQKFLEAARDISQRRYQAQRTSVYAAVSALVLITAGLSSYVMRPEAYAVTALPPIGAAGPHELDRSGIEPQLGPLTTALQNEIATALEATEWPALDPSMDAVINGPEAIPEIAQCGGTGVPNASCIWGPETAPAEVVLVGDSVGMTYAGPLRQLASTGAIRVHSQAMYGCAFTGELIVNPEVKLMDACPGRKQHAVDVINTIRPDVVIIANSYEDKQSAGSSEEMTPVQWSSSMRQIIDQFRGSGAQIVFLAAPPADIQISECYGKRASTPADCISNVTRDWTDFAETEQDLAKSIEAKWIDSRTWFCRDERYCPSFVGTVPTKMDRVHMTPAYGQKIAPVIQESLRESGVIP